MRAKEALQTAVFQSGSALRELCEAIGMNLAQQADRPIVAKFNGYDDFRVSCGTIPGLLRELSASTEHRHKEVVRVRVSALVQRLQRNGRPLEVVQRSIESILTRWTPAEDDASFKQDHSTWAQLDGLRSRLIWCPSWL